MGPGVRDDWPEVLASCIEDARGKSFSRGVFDCCLWAADVVRAMTGIDYASEFRGKYATLKGAIGVLNGRTLDAVMDEKLQRVDHPSRGDVVLIPIEITQQPIAGLGICLGDKIAMIGDGGLEFLPLQDAACAWGVIPRG